VGVSPRNANKKLTQPRSGDMFSAMPMSPLRGFFVARCFVPWDFTHG
jgi:hypothetical protein